MWFNTSPDVASSNPYQLSFSKLLFLANNFYMLVNMARCQKGEELGPYEAVKIIFVIVFTQIIMELGVWFGS